MATLQFQTKTGSNSFANDALAYAQVTNQAPVAVSSALTLYCTVGTPSTPVAPSSNNVTVSTASVAAIGVSATSPSWITLGGNAGSLTGTPTTSSSSALVFTAAPAAGCNSLTRSGQSSSGSISIAAASGNSYWTPVSIPVTLQIVSTSPLTANPTSVSLTYRKGGSAATATIALTSSSANGSYFTVSGQLGAYITSDSSSGTAPKTGTGSRIITISTTSLNDSLAPGTTTYNIIFHVTGCADLVVPVKVTVNNAAPVLSVSEGTTRSLNWDPSTAVPTPVVTLVSSDTPIAYTITSVSGIVIGPTAGGLAFNYGTQVPVVFDPAQFQSATPGQTLSGKLVVSGSNSTVTITFNVLVTSASTQASLGALSPSNLPTGTAGQVFTVKLYGTGFVASTTAHYSSIVGLATSAAAAGFTTSETAISAKVVNSSEIDLTITVPATGKDANLDFTKSGTVYIGVCNPNGSLTCTPSAALPLSIGSGPTISAITSAASFTQYSSTANGTPGIAPFDMISIFGTNFCNSSGTGCGMGIMLGKPDANNIFQPNLSPDGNRNLTVNFYTHPAPANLASASPLAQAPLLFATDKQINALIPGDNTSFTALVGGSGVVDIAVAFGASGSISYSNVVAVSVVAADPGILTIGSDGQGDAAALVANTYALVNNATPAIVRPAGSTPPTDTVQIYMTGLGIPSDSSCTTISAYDTNASLLSIDGAVLMPAYLTSGKGVPCFGTPLTGNPVKFGSGTAVAAQAEDYAGWVSGSVEGLYQVNATLPDNVSANAVVDASGTITAPFVTPVQVPVTLTNTSASLSTQTGVTMWVAPQLGWDAAFTTCAVAKSSTSTCTIPAAIGGTTGSPAYTYAANLPSFLSITDNTANTITDASGPANADLGSYIVTVTAADSNVSAPKSLTATGYFNLDVQDSSSPLISLTAQTNSPAGAITGITPAVYGTAVNPVATVSVAQGSAVTPTGNLMFTLTTTESEPTITIDQNGNVSTTNLTPAGTYHATVTVTDVGGTGKTGTLKFTLPVALLVSSSNGANLSANASQTTPITNLSVSGASGGITYAVVNGPIAVSSTGAVTLSSASQGKIYSATVKASVGANVGYINLSIRTN